MTSPVIPPQAIRSAAAAPADPATRNGGLPPFCPACGAGFDGRCRYCGLTVADKLNAPIPVLAVTQGTDEITTPLAALAAAAEPLALLMSWRAALPPGGRLRLTPEGGPRRWRIPKTALMRLMERAGFRLVGRGWWRKTWLFRRS